MGMIMKAILVAGDADGDVGRRGRDPRHAGELRAPARPGRDGPRVQAPEAQDVARDDRAPGGEGPAGAAGADRAAGPAPVRGAAGGPGAGRAGDRAGGVPRGGPRALVDRPHPRVDGPRAAAVLAHREARGRVIPFPTQRRAMPAPAASPTDAQLILAVLEREDRRAFGVLVERHQSQVRTVLRRMTRGDLALADDLAQEVFVLAWRNLGKFRFEAKFSTWLYRIAFNTWQSEARKKHEVLLDTEDGSPAESLEMATEMPDVVARVDLERAMAVLSDGERAAITACFYADLSHEEAAEALGLPLGTVKTHILRARAKLKARLAKEKP